VECFGRHDDGVDEIPQLRLLEELLFDITAIHDLIAQQIRVVFVCDLP
jgi:hypothetical protein